jgi:hypothetical protein
MKLFGCLVAGMVSFCPIASRSSETARATIFCYSPHFQRGVELNGNYCLDVTSIPGGINGELALDFFNSGYSHSGYLSLVDELLGQTLTGQLALDVPDGGDLNHDGFPDFFQITQGVTNLVSTGAYHLDLYGSGSTTATWNRNAGSKDGDCSLTMKLLPFQTLTFDLPFEIMEYKGSLTYAPATTNVSGSLKLVQTGNAASLMNGMVQFVKAPANRYNELTLQAGAWTNQSQRFLSYVSHVINREESWPTNYYGYLEFDDDSNLATPFPYAVWMLSIDDPNDTDRDGIPDFSDDPTAGASPRRPLLELIQNGTNLVITLHADVGHLHEIQRVPDLFSTNWLTAASLVLTNDPQSVLIPLPSEAASFWRVKAK